MNVHGVAVIITPAKTKGLSRNDLTVAIQKTYGVADPMYEPPVPQHTLDDILEELDSARKALIGEK